MHNSIGNPNQSPVRITATTAVRDFLLAVVPWPATKADGFITIHWHRPGMDFLGRSCRTIDEALQIITQLNGFDVYFCLSRQRDGRGKRSHANATGMQAIWTDADVDPDNPKCYASHEEAINAILDFCRQQQIPEPSLIVDSGGGLHVYWLSDRILSVDEWQPFADALMNAIRHAGLKIKDIGVTGDAARVLRVPGTLNYKYDPPRPVRLMPKYSTGARHDFATAFAPLLKLAPAAGTKPAPGALPDWLKNLLLTPVPKCLEHLPPIDLGGGIENPSLPFATIKAECGWLREAFETGGKEFDQPQWNLTTLAATFLENGRELAHQFGNQHEGYLATKGETTEALWHRKVRERESKDLGWPSCRAIQDAGSAHCQKCPHFGLIKSPLNLALAADEAEAEERRKEQIAENIRIGNDVTEPLLPQVMTLKEMHERLVFIGSSAGVADIVTGRVRKKDHASEEYAASTHAYLQGTQVKKGPALKFWLASKDRKSVEVVAWVPGAGRICQPPEGPGPAFNTWQGLSPMIYPEDWQERVKPFLEHVEFLVPIEAERERFLHWLAHIVQAPEVLPHTGYLMITETTGIGRNLLASILIRALRGFVAAGVSLPELLDKGFTGRLSQKLLIVVDEAREGSGERRYERANRLKQLTTEEHRHINPKYGHQSVEKNCGRWLKFSNHQDAIPFDNTDRRDIVIANPTIRREDAYYVRLYGLLNDNAFIGSVRHWLETRDIAGFRPGAHAPMNAAKLRAINEMLTETERAAIEFKEDCETELTSRAAIKDHAAISMGPGSLVSDMHLAHAIRRAGMVSAGRRIRANKNGVEKRFSVVIVRGEWTAEVIKKADPGKLLEAMGLGDWSAGKPPR